MSPSIDYRVLGPGHYSLLVNGKSYEVFVRKEKQGFVVEVEGCLVPVYPDSSGQAREAEEGKGPVTVAAPMPGRVIHIKVVEGESVKAGQGVLIVEAMKMENELQAPRSGRVVKIKVQVGQAVEAGQELAMIE